MLATWDWKICLTQSIFWLGKKDWVFILSKVSTLVWWNRSKKNIIKVHILYLGISTNLTTSFKWIICVPNLCYFSTNISRKTCEKKTSFSCKICFHSVKCVFSYKNSPLFWHKNFEKGKYKNYVLILENKKWFFFVISTFKSLFIFKFQHHPIFLKSSFWPYLFFCMPKWIHPYGLW